MTFTFRFAEPSDSERLSAWVAGNPQIDRGDVRAAGTKENPSSTYLVIEHDGQPVMFMPVYMVLRIGYLAFNPEADRETREAALEEMLKVVVAFAAIYKVATIDVLTRSGIPVAEWARAHGFNPDPRELFSLNLSPSEEKAT